FTVSADLKQHLVAEGFPPERVGVIYNGIDIGGDVPHADARRRMRDNLRVADGTLVVGTIARLDSVKDLGTLIDAVGSISRNIPSTLLIIGDGAERGHLEALTSRSGD